MVQWIRAQAYGAWDVGSIPTGGIDEMATHMTVRGMIDALEIGANSIGGGCEVKRCDGIPEGNSLVRGNYRNMGGKRGLITIFVWNVDDELGELITLAHEIGHHIDLASDTWLTCFADDPSRFQLDREAYAWNRARELLKKVGFGKWGRFKKHRRRSIGVAARKWLNDI